MENRNLVINGVKYYTAVCPQWGNSGEDMNWITYIVVGHTDLAAVSQDAINALRQEMCLDASGFILSEDDELDDEVSDEEMTIHFIDHLVSKGYLAFKCEPGLLWLAD